MLVLLPVDASRHSEAAVDWYIEVLHKDDSIVSMVHCMEPPLVGELPLDITAETMENLMKQEKSKAADLSDKYTRKLKDHNVECDFKIIFGQKAGEAIVSEADKAQASLIVTGSRGLGAIRRAILGSVSDYILRHAHCPVIIYKA